MISSRVPLITLAIVSCHMVCDAEHYWKWLKPYAWDGRQPKYVHSAVYKPQPSYALAQHEIPYPPLSVAHEKPYQPVHQKPYKQDHCELRKVVFTPGSESPQVRTRCSPRFAIFRT
jgi:hypothetical protein